MPVLCRRSAVLIVILQLQLPLEKVPLASLIWHREVDHTTNSPKSPTSPDRMLPLDFPPPPHHVFIFPYLTLTSPYSCPNFLFKVYSIDAQLLAPLPPLSIQTIVLPTRPLYSIFAWQRDTLLGCLISPPWILKVARRKPRKWPT